MPSNPKRAVRLAVAHFSAATTIFIARGAAVSRGWVIRGLILMGIAVSYLIYELVTSRPIVRNVPGMFRILIAIFAVTIFAGVNRDTIKGFFRPGPIPQEEQIQIPPFFKEAADEHRNDLGKPTASATPQPHAYKAEHEHGIVLWMFSYAKIYLLPDDLSQPWDWRTDVTAPGDNPYYYYDGLLTGREPFKHIPKGLYPPWGGVALRWEQEPEKLHNEVGWRKWHCPMDAGVYTQRFEKGFIVGPFYWLDNYDKNFPQIFVILDNGKWDSLRANPDTAKLADCNWIYVYGRPEYLRYPKKKTIAGIMK